MKEIKMLKEMNTYFGNAYVRFFFFFFSFCENFNAIMSCNTYYEITLFFVIYNLRLHEFV